jgi:hypothetical protein
MPARSPSAHAHCLSGDLTTSYLLPRTHQISPYAMPALTHLPRAALELSDFACRSAYSLPHSSARSHARDSRPPPTPPHSADHMGSNETRLRLPGEDPHHAATITRGVSPRPFPPHLRLAREEMCHIPLILRLPGEELPISRGGTSDCPGRNLRLPGEEPPIARGGN